MPRNTASPDEQKFRAEDDVRTMIRAEEIRNDKPRLGRAMKEAKVQMAALKKVNGK